LVDDSGNVITSCADKADMFNNYYASTGTVDNGQTPPNNNKKAVLLLLQGNRAMSQLFFSV